MHRLLKFVEREVHGLHETAYLLGFFALLSTALALVRDRFLAGIFGAGTTLDIYYAAFKIPDLIFASIALLASVFILIPVLSSAKNDAEQHRIIGNVLASFSVILFIVTVVAWILMPYILSLFFAPLVAKGGLLLFLSRVLLLQPILLAVSGVLASVVQVHGRYVLYALAPLLYNTSIIAGIILLYPLFGVPGIAYGVVIGALLHVAVQIPFVRRIGFLRLKDFVIRPAVFWNIVSTSIPRTLSVLSNQITLFILISMSAALGAGAVSIFSFSINLQAAPLSIIGASYSVAAFPTLSRLFANGKTNLFCSHIVAAARHILFWSIPLTTLVIVLRAYIVRVVLGSGAFDWNDTRLTAAALALFIVSLTAQSLSLLFVRGYYAAGETKKPLIINLITTIGIIVGAFGFTELFKQYDVWRYFIESLLRVSDIPGTVALMLPLSYSLFATINAIIFIVLFQRDFGILGERINNTFFESFSSAVVGAFFSWKTLEMIAPYFSNNTFIGVFMIGFIAGVVGIVVIIGMLHLLGNKEIKEVSATLHNKFWRHVIFIFRVTNGRKR